ncbi:MAG: hypothetical protein H6732_08185 [Alphaproteobacteria bacterium]|nr:hypothetical protein [Alphaproteobacteria bacterium]
MDVIARVDEIVGRLVAASWKEREAIKDELLAACRDGEGSEVVPHLEERRKTVPLEVRWEIDEVLEALAPPPAPPEEPEEEAAEELPPEDEPPADGRLRMSDLKEVYSDPRGIALFTDKPGKRWFLQQVDPYTGQPVMMELSPADVERVKAQLKGSPYWRLGSGVLS